MHSSKADKHTYTHKHTHRDLSNECSRKFPAWAGKEQKGAAHDTHACAQQHTHNTHSHTNIHNHARAGQPQRQWEPLMVSRQEANEYLRGRGPGSCLFRLTEV